MHRRSPSTTARGPSCAQRLSATLMNAQAGEEAETSTVLVCSTPCSGARRSRALYVISGWRRRPPPPWSALSRACHHHPYELSPTARQDGPPWHSTPTLRPWSADHRMLRRGVDSARHDDPDPRIGDLRLWSRSQAKTRQHRRSWRARRPTTSTLRAAPC